MSEELETLFVTAQEEGIRIDKLLSNHYPEFSRTYFQNLIQDGCVLLNGQLVKKRVCPEEGDEIEICFQALPEMSLEPEEIPLEILYEDDYLLAVNKPAGMVVHPAPGHRSGTFANALLAYCKGIVPSQGDLRPGIVHRLDKDTTGVLLAAKTATAHQKLIELFANRQIDKLYLAICSGRPRNGLFEGPIGRHPIHRKEMAVLPDGREASTLFQVAACNDRLSLVLARPKTGRTHQIRVHLKALGTPVLGDPLYGNRLNRELFPPRLLLHAYRLSFTHPMTGCPMSITAPIPEDLKLWMKKFCDTSSCVLV